MCDCVVVVVEHQTEENFMFLFISNLLDYFLCVFVLTSSFVCVCVCVCVCIVVVEHRTKENLIFYLFQICLIIFYICFCINFLLFSF